MHSKIAPVKFKQTTFEKCKVIGHLINTHLLFLNEAVTLISHNQMQDPETVNQLDANFTN